ncbi:UNVERIFIED_CONTAM: hypothetical protein GTU68_010725, partial [Idotea baltica]|nr:hypothetical protein [Idotea baltica]
LVLGPFQGPIACTRIKKGDGVCGKAWLNASTIIVPNVDEFPGHIACSSESKSEIVVPIFNASGDTEFILDIDSASLDDFSAIDQKNLELLANILSEHFAQPSSC